MLMRLCTCSHDVVYWSCGDLCDLRGLLLRSSWTCDGVVKVVVLQGEGGVLLICLGVVCCLKVKSADYVCLRIYYRSVARQTVCAFEERLLVVLLIFIFWICVCLVEEAEEDTSILCLPVSSCEKLFLYTNCVTSISCSSFVTGRLYMRTIHVRMYHGKINYLN